MRKASKPFSIKAGALPLNCGNSGDEINGTGGHRSHRRLLADVLVVGKLKFSSAGRASPYN
jgi:hypothetical protein